MIDPPDLSPGSSPLDTNRTNRTRSSGGKYESAHFLTPASMLCGAPWGIAHGIFYLEAFDTVHTEKLESNLQVMLFGTIL